MEKEILVADELAEWLRVDKQRIYDLVRKKQIPVILIGERQYRFSTSEIKRWLSEGGSSTADEQ